MGLGGRVVVGVQACRGRGREVRQLEREKLREGDR
jgi:hypothetical protein